MEFKLHNNIGVIFAMTRRLDLAEQEFRKEIEINPQYSDSYFNLGVLYGEKGDWLRMEEMWRKTLEIDPHLSFIRLRRRPRLRAVSPIEKASQRWHFCVRAWPWPWPWRNA